jgi:hypothetical protein
MKTTIDLPDFLLIAVKFPSPNPDGQRFLVNSRRPEDTSLPITVIAPWASGVKP